MYKFGNRSKQKLATCHPVLRQIAEDAIRRSPFDWTIVWGFRDATEQNLMVRSGASKTPWPKSKHNYMQNGKPCSLAIDIAPWIDGSIPWNDTHSFAVIAGILMSSAIELDERLRWGGDWNMNGSTTDQTFMDWGHVELVGHGR